MYNTVKIEEVQHLSDEIKQEIGFMDPMVQNVTTATKDELSFDNRIYEKDGVKELQKQFGIEATNEILRLMFLMYKINIKKDFEYVYESDKIKNFDNEFLDNLTSFRTINTFMQNNFVSSWLWYKALPIMDKKIINYFNENKEKISESFNKIGLIDEIEIPNNIKTIDSIVLLGTNHIFTKVELEKVLDILNNLEKSEITLGNNFKLIALCGQHINNSLNEDTIQEDKMTEGLIKELIEEKLKSVLGEKFTKNSIKIISTPKKSVWWFFSTRPNTIDTVKQAVNEGINFENGTNVMIGVQPSLLRQIDDIRLYNRNFKFIPASKSYETIKRTVEEENRGDLLELYISQLFSELAKRIYAINKIIEKSQYQQVENTAMDTDVEQSDEMLKSVQPLSQKEQYKEQQKQLDLLSMAGNSFNLGSVVQSK